MEYKTAYECNILVVQLICNRKKKSRKKCPYSELFWSELSRIHKKLELLEIR